MDVGDTYGEMGLLARDACPASLVAAGPALLLEFGPPALAEVEQRRPEIVHSLRLSAAQVNYSLADPENWLTHNSLALLTG